MASYEKSGFEKHGYDVEYQQPGVYNTHHSVIAPDASGAVHGESFVVGDSTYAKLQRLAGRFRIEQRGIERVPEDERTDKSTLKVGTMVCVKPSINALADLMLFDSGSLRTWWSLPSRLVFSPFQSSRWVSSTRS